MRGLETLIVDDEKNIRTTLAACLEALGCKVGSAATADAALAEVGKRSYGLAFVDLRLGSADGLQLIPRLKAQRPHMEIVLITAYATIQTAVEAMRLGASDVLPKPFTPAQVEQLVRRVEEKRALERQVSELRSRLDEVVPSIELQTRSPRMKQLLEVLDKTAQHDVPVLLTGENGTGKSLLARRLHQQSARRDHPFVVVNCPTLSEELLASELFGHVKGAFTGAIRDQPGRVERADGGTLFLDEIGEIPTALQTKLLRFLQDKEFERLGESVTRHSDVRIVAATNRDLEQAVADGRFRQDLLYRLNTVELTVPALRERTEDLLPLAHHFLEHFRRSTQRSQLTLSTAAEPALLGYRWPGNVRELRNAMERAAILSSSDEVGADALPERIAAHHTGTPFVGGDFTLEDVQHEHLQRVVARTPTRDEAARVLGIDPSTLWRKLRRGDG